MWNFGFHRFTFHLANAQKLIVICLHCKFNIIAQRNTCRSLTVTRQTKLNPIHNFPVQHDSSLRCSMCIFDTRPFAWKLENWLKAQELLWLNGNESQPKWGKTSGKKHKRIECLWLHCSVCTNPLDNFAFACVFTLNIRYRMRIMHIHALLLPLLISMAQVLWLCYEKLGTDGTLFHIPDETAYVFVLKKFNHSILDSKIAIHKTFDKVPFNLCKENSKYW